MKAFTARRACLATPLACCAFVAAGGVQAQAAPPAAGFPNQVVHIIVPTTAGGVSDLLARTLADKLAAMWKQPVIVDNRPGLPGTVAAAKSAADGYTLLLTGNGHVVVNAIVPSLPFDAVKDFAPVGQVASVPFVLVARRSLPADDLKGVLALARAKPGALNLALPGQGTSASILAELFKAETKISVTDVPFKGAPDAHLALQRGEVDLHFTAAYTAGPLIQSQKVKAIAVASDTRLDSLPAVPTMAQAGLPQLKYDGWFGLLAPAKTPLPVREKIYADVARVLAQADVRASLQSQGFVVRSSGPAQFEATLKADAERYAPLFKNAAR